MPPSAASAHKSKPAYRLNSSVSQGFTGCNGHFSHLRMHAAKAGASERQGIQRRWSWSPGSTLHAPVAGLRSNVRSSNIFLAAVAAPSRGDGNPVIVAGAGLAADARAGIAHSSPKPRPRASSAARSDADAPV